MADTAAMHARRHRDQLSALLRALGLDPADVPIDARIEFDGATLRIERYVRGERPTRERVTIDVEYPQGGGVGD